MDTALISKVSTEDVIQRCTRTIEEKEIVAGIGNPMVAPLVSIVMGSGAEEHFQQIRDVYDYSWSSKHTVFCKGAYRSEELEDACSKAMSQAMNNECLDRSVLKLAWYWDIMDDRFDEYFRAVKQPFGLPLGCSHTKVFFIFCRQMRTAEQEITHQRMKQLIAWVNETQATLVVLSDQSAGASLPGRAVSENYHLAATIVMLLNTRSNSETNPSMANQLAFEMKSRRIWTAGYGIGKKPYRDIINVSLLRIIDKGCEMRQGQSSSYSLQSVLCGSSGDYYAFMDKVFSEVLEPLCPSESERVFLEDLPRTQDMEALCNRLINGPDAGFNLRRLLQRRGGSWENAITSLGDFWTCCVKKYYVEPIRRFLESATGHRAVVDAINNRFAQQCSLKDMAQLHEEAEKLRYDNRYRELELDPVVPGIGESLCSFLHKCACRDVKGLIYPDLFCELADAMDLMCSKAKGFKPLMNMVCNSFKNSGYSKLIMDSYGEHMKRLLENNEELFRRMFLPCNNESELLEQMERIFLEMVDRDPDKRFYGSLVDHIRFQIENGNVTAGDDVIASCFKMDLKNLGRFRSYKQNDGYLYCIMDNSMIKLLNNIENEDIGNHFVINRSDRIERIYLYSIDEDAVQYSNG